VFKKSSSTLGGADSDPYGDYESYNINDKEQTAVALICNAFGVNISK
jgi:hypothetical protein